jgi:hypothetical protein
MIFILCVLLAYLLVGVALGRATFVGIMKGEQRRERCRWSRCSRSGHDANHATHWTESYSNARILGGAAVPFWPLHVLVLLCLGIYSGLTGLLFRPTRQEREATRAKTREEERAKVIEDAKKLDLPIPASWTGDAEDHNWIRAVKG